MLDQYASMTTVMRVPALEQWAADLGDQIGFPEDQLKYVLGMLAGYPLAIIFALLPFGMMRHAFSLISGVFLAQFVFASGWIHSLASATIVYFLIAATQSIRALDKYRHILVFVFMMGYMTASHVYRIYVDYMGWSLDFTGPQMLLTIKLTSMAYAVYDGTVDRARLDKAIADNTEKRKISVYKVRECGAWRVQCPFGRHTWASRHMGIMVAASSLLDACGCVSCRSAWVVPSPASPTWLRTMATCTASPRTWRAPRSAFVSTWTCAKATSGLLARRFPAACLRRSRLP